MKREATLCILVALVAAAVLLHPSVFGLGEVLPGGDRAYGQAWGAWSIGRDVALDGEVALAGWPVLLTIRALDLVLPLAVATTLAVLGWLAAGGVVAYLAVRDISRPGAVGAALICGANPALLEGVADGRYEWLVVPWVVAALSRRPGWVALGLAGAAAHSPLLGLATAILATIPALARSWRAGAATLAAGALFTGLSAWPHRALTDLPVAEAPLNAFANAGDFLEPFFAWREDAVTPGVALWLVLAGGAWLLWKRRLDAGLAVAFAVGLVLALGTELYWGGGTVRVLQRPVPMPASIVQALLPDHPLLTWKSALVPAMVAGGLALAPLRRWGLAVASVVFLAGALEPIGATDARMPRAVEQLAGGEGPVLHLPVATEGHNLRALWFQTAHGRPLVTPMGAMTSSELLGDPLVVLAVNAEVQEPRHAIPDRHAKTMLMTLGVREVLLHRDDADLGSLVLLDQLLGSQLGSPQRDLVGEVDVYRLPSGHGGEEPEVVGFQEPRDPPAGWLRPQDWLEKYGS